MASMTASPVGVDRPAERHRRALGHAVEDGLRLNLVEAHVERLGSVETPDRGCVPISRQTVLGGLFDGQIAPAHEHMFASGQDARLPLRGLQVTGMPADLRSELLTGLLRSSAQPLRRLSRPPYPRGRPSPQAQPTTWRFTMRISSMLGATMIVGAPSSTPCEPWNAEPAAPPHSRARPRRRRPSHLKDAANAVLGLHQLKAPVHVGQREPV